MPGINRKSDNWSDKMYEISWGKLRLSPVFMAIFLVSEKLGVITWNKLMNGKCAYLQVISDNGINQQEQINYEVYLSGCGCQCQRGRNTVVLVPIKSITM